MNQRRAGEHFEVETHTVCEGWVNCWSVSDENGSAPQTFATKEEAEKELADFLNDAADMDYDRADYRIVRVTADGERTPEG